MSNWIVRYATKAAITFLVPTLILGIGYIAWYASKIPGLETKLSKHDDKLATISANLIFLMNKAGKPLKKNEIKDLLSYIKDSGNAKSKLIKFAEVVDGSGVIKVVDWVPSEDSKYLKVTLRKGMKTKNKDLIAKWITTAILADKKTVWSAEKGAILAKTRTGKIKLYTVTNFNSVVMKRYIAELNHMSKASTKIVTVNIDKNHNVQ